MEARAWRQATLADLCALALQATAILQAAQTAALQRCFDASKHACHRFVRFDHEHFDECVREGLVFRHRIDHMAFGVVDQLDDRQIEMNHPIVLTTTTDDLRECVGARERAQQFFAVDGIGL